VDSLADVNLQLVQVHRLVAVHKEKQQAADSQLLHRVADQSLVMLAALREEELLHQLQAVQRRASCP
jgi:hypothetical protein